MSDLSDVRNLSEQDIPAAPTASAAPAQADTRNQPALLPRVDVLEDDTGITLLADLPGVAKEQLSLDIDGDTLRIEGVVARQRAADFAPVYAERRVQRYRRAFTLGRELDSSRIEASLKDGVLNLRIPKLASAQSRRIQVQVG